MYGLILNVAILYILYQYWTNRMIELKWKIILTTALVFSRFISLGLFSMIIHISILVIMIIGLRWYGSKIR